MSCGTPFIVHFGTTFTILGFRNLFVIFYYVHYAMVMSKRNKISFQRYLHKAAMIMKKIVYIRFHKKYLNCYYVHYAAIMTKKYIFSFQHYYIHYTVMMRKNQFFPYC